MVDAVSEEEYDNQKIDNATVVDDISNANHHLDKVSTKTGRNHKNRHMGIRNAPKPEKCVNENDPGSNKNHTRAHFNPEVVLDPNNKGVMTQGDRLNAIKARKQTQSLQGGVNVGNIRNITSTDQSHSRVKSVPAPLALHPGGGASGRASSSATSTGRSES